MKKTAIVLLIFFLLISCKHHQKIELRFLSEYVIKDSTNFKNTIVGGLSGIDLYENDYYLVVDDIDNPRILKASISFDNEHITNINFKKVIFLNDSTQSFLTKNALDIESVFVDANGNFNLASEGKINNNMLPTIFTVDTTGVFLQNYHLPNHFNNISNFRHNATFEASSRSSDNNGFWFANEAPLYVDSNESSTSNNNAVVRFTYFDYQTKRTTKQYAYRLEKVPKPAKGDVNINGVTAMLAYDKNRFLVVERAYQNNYGSYGNTIVIFDAVANNNTTNIIGYDSLKNTSYMPLQKKMIFDFDVIKDKLTDKIIDNIEGITFGPTLQNGNKTLLLVADDNFQIYGKQLNQFIVLEIIEND